MMFLVGFLFANKLRKSGYTTVVDFMNERFGKKMGMLYLVVQMLAAIGWLGGQLVALGVIVFLTTGFSMAGAIILASFVMIIVTYYGGLWALSRVDVVALALIIIGLFVMLPVVIGEVGGWDVFFSEADNWLELPTLPLLLLQPKMVDTYGIRDSWALPFTFLPGLRWVLVMFPVRLSCNGYWQQRMKE